MALHLLAPDPRAVRDHLEDAPDHGLDLPEWAELLEGLLPGEYADRPAPAAPAIALTREARVEVMRRRQAARQGLYHPGDLWRRQATDDGIQAGVVAEHEANGAPVVNQRLGARRAA